MDRFDYNRLQEHRIPRVLPEYPSYRFGRYTQEYQSFDPRTFGTSTHPLKTVDYIIKEYYFEEELRKWGRQCNTIIIETEARNWSKLIDFLLNNNLYEDYYNSEEVEKDYGHWKDFPKLEKPVLPPKPEIESPWK